MPYCNALRNAADQAVGSDATGLAEIIRFLCEPHTTLYLHLSSGAGFIITDDPRLARAIALEEWLTFGGGADAEALARHIQHKLEQLDPFTKRRINPAAWAPSRDGWKAEWSEVGGSIVMYVVPT